jgi:hypothetical protein
MVRVTNLVSLETRNLFSAMVTSFCSSRGFCFFNLDIQTMSESVESDSPISNNGNQNDTTSTPGGSPSKSTPESPPSVQVAKLGLLPKDDTKSVSWFEVCRVRCPGPFSVYRAVVGMVIDPFVSLRDVRTGWQIDDAVCEDNGVVVRYAVNFYKRTTFSNAGVVRWYRLTSLHVIQNRYSWRRGPIEGNCVYHPHRPARTYLVSNMCVPSRSYFFRMLKVGVMDPGFRF